MITMRTSNERSPSRALRKTCARVRLCWHQRALTSRPRISMRPGHRIVSIRSPSGRRHKKASGSKPSAMSRASCQSRSCWRTSARYCRGGAPKRARNARLNWLVPPKPQRLTMSFERALVLVVRQHEPQGLVEPALQQHGANAAFRRQEPVERRARDVDRIGDLVGPKLRVPQMRVDVIQRGLSPRLHVIRFIAGQPRTRAGGRQRHDALDRRLGFAHRQIVGLRIKFLNRCADQTRRAARRAER